MRLRAKMLNREEKETFPKKFGGNSFLQFQEEEKFQKEKKKKY